MLPFLEITIYKGVKGVTEQFVPIDHKGVKGVTKRIVMTALLLLLKPGPRGKNNVILYKLSQHRKHLRHGKLKKTELKEATNC